MATGGLWLSVYVDDTASNPGSGSPGVAQIRSTAQRVVSIAFRGKRKLCKGVQFVSSRRWLTGSLEEI